MSTTALCQHCPIRDDRYIPSDQQDKRTIENLRAGLEARGDFIEWLFDHSEHCDHISYQEAWEEFKTWQDETEDQQTAGGADPVKPVLE